MQLPKELEDEFWQEMQKYEEGRHMPYIMSFEREAIERGLKQGIEKGIEKGFQQDRRQGMLDGIELGLKLKFGKEGLKLLPEIREIEDLNV